MTALGGAGLRAPLRRSGVPARAHDVLFENRIGGVDFDQRYVIAPEIGEVLKHALRVDLVELGSLHHGMPQHQTAIAGKINIDDFDVGIDVTDVVLPRQLATNPTVAALIMDGIDPDAGAFLRIVMQVEHPQLPDQPWAQELTDEAFVAIVGPGIAQHRHDVAGPGNVRKPLAILLRRDW